MLSNTIHAFALVSLFLTLVSGQTAGKCSGQSCYIATLSGSTGAQYKQQGGKKPAGGTAAGDRCIKQYYTKFGMPPPEGIKRFGRSVDQKVENEAEMMMLEARRAMYAKSSTNGDLNEIAGNMVQEDKRQLGGCKANSLIFARGTLETGTMGITVGPAMSLALGNSWYVEGVSYDASMLGDYCVGLPGGWAAKEQINKLVAKCPNTKIVVSGYSQGAMVARIGSAFANEAAQKRIAGLALFGDPFNGSPVKGIPQSKVKTWCNLGDGVCKGDFSISAAHLSYTGSPVREAAAWANQMVKAA